MILTIDLTRNIILLTNFGIMSDARSVVIEDITDYPDMDDIDMSDVNIQNLLDEVLKTQPESINVEDIMNQQCKDTKEEEENSIKSLEKRYDDVFEYTQPDANKQPPPLPLKRGLVEVKPLLNPIKTVSQVIEKCRLEALETLDLSFRMLEDVPLGLNTLLSVKILKLNGNVLDNISKDELPPNLKVLNLSRNNFVEFEDDSIHEHVEELNLNYNRIKKLTMDNILSVKKLSVVDNGLRRINLFPPKLVEIDLRYNYLQTVPMFPDSLRKIDLASNKLLVLKYSTLNEGLQYIDFSRNAITEFPICPDSLEEIHMSENEIDDIDKGFPRSLTTLVCVKCKLNTISVPFPSGLLFLDLCENSIDKIPDLPMFIEHVDVSNNILQEIDDDLPTTITYLNVSSNRISEIPNDLKDRKDMKFDYSDNMLDIQGYGSDNDSGCLSYFNNTSEFSNAGYKNTHTNHFQRQQNHINNSFKSLGSPSYKQLPISSLMSSSTQYMSSYNNSYSTSKYYNNYKSDYWSDKLKKDAIFCSKNTRNDNPYMISIRHTKTVVV